MQATMGGIKPRREPAVPKPNIQTSIRIDPAIYDVAKRAADKAGVSLNAWIEQAMKEKAEREPRER
jgi:predicted HicB family RNase H-like nuclease